MSSGSRGCANDPHIFCYICGNFVVKSQRQNVTSFVKNVYYAYSRVKLGDQDKTWAPHKVCHCCVKSLRREPKGHGNDCYFCTCNVSGFTMKNKHNIQYPNLPSAIRPVLHGPDVPIPTPPPVLKNVGDPSTDVSSSEFQSEEKSEYECSEDERIKRFSQEDLNDLVRDLDLPKVSAVLLGSH